MTGQPEDIEDFDSAFDWLEVQDDAVRRCFALRTALRILPVSLSVFDQPMKLKIKRDLTLATLLATFISSVVGTYPTDDMRVTAARAAGASDATIDTAGAVDAAVDAAARAASNAAYAAADAFAAAGAAVYTADAAYAAVWELARADARITAEHGAEGLMAQPLFKTDERSDDVSDLEDLLLKFLTNFEKSDEFKEGHWGVWVDWYKNLLTDTSRKLFTPEQEKGIALKSDEFWMRDAADVNAEIERIVGWDPLTQKMLDGQDRASGRRWLVKGNVYGLVDESLNEDDETIARAVDTQADHERLLTKIENFVSAANTIEEEYGWDGFSDVWTEFLAASKPNGEGLIDDVDALYDATISLGSFLGMDNDLRKAPAGNAGPLNAVHRRGFEEVVRSAAPFVRRFPSAQEKDLRQENALAQLSQELAKRLINSAQDKGLITEQDHRLVASMIAAEMRNGPEAARSANRGKGSVVNYITVASIFLGGLLADDILDKVEPYEQTVEWFSEHAEDLIDMLGDLPADVRASVEMVLESLEKERQGSASESQSIALNERRKRKPKTY